MLVADIANLATFLFNNQKFLITLRSGTWLLKLLLKMSLGLFRRPFPDGFGVYIHINFLSHCCFMHYESVYKVTQL